MLLGGTDPDTLDLNDWLDAGERMLLERVEDPVLFDILTRLIASESEDEMDGCFGELRELNAAHQIEFDKALRKERAEKQLGGRRISEKELQDAADEWSSIGQPKEPEG